MSIGHRITVEDKRENVVEFNKYIAELGIQEICRVDYEEDIDMYKFTQIIPSFYARYSETENRVIIKEGCKPMNIVDYYDDLLIIITHINIVGASIGVPGARF